MARIEVPLGISTIHVNGNRGFYGSRFLRDGGEVFAIQGVRFAAASLWTYLTEEAIERRSLSGRHLD